MRLSEKKFLLPKYLERLNNPTDWTKEILLHYLSPSRTICSVISSKSIGVGGYFSTIRFLGENIPNNQNVENLKPFLPKILKLNGITRMHIILGDNSYGQMNTEEKKYRSSQGLNDQIVSQAVIIEGLNYQSLETAIISFKNKYSLKKAMLNYKILYLSKYFNSTRFDINEKIVVIGSGIVGICTAVELINRGFSVTMIDPNEPGSQTSYGNAGVLTILH